MMRDDFERNEQTVETLCLKQKEVLLKLYHIDKDIYHFIKFYLEYFSKFAFQEVTCPVMQPNRHISVTQNCRVSVKLYHCH